MTLAPPRGTRDFYPEDLRLRDWLFGEFRDVARAFGFEEYDAPILEMEELYVRKAGEEITAQLYGFEDKGGRRVALRPEMTPSLARMVLQKGPALPMPLRWFSVPQCWRYERSTRGRRREHYQWNMDVLGVAGVAAEAELIAAMTTAMSRFGLSSDDVVVRVSDRRILQTVVEREGVGPEAFPEVCVLVDKLEKVPREAISEDLGRLGLRDASVDRILDTLSIRALDDLDAALGAASGSVADLKRLFDLMEAYGRRDWMSLDASVVRGLAYYTGTVFEAFDRQGALRAVAGGGRYDRLLSSFGGEDVPACGFGFGDVVIVELLRERGKLPELPRRLDDVVFAFDESLRAAATEVATRLRDAGRAVDLVLDARKVKWAYRHADRVGASRVVFLAPEEWSRGAVRVKDLATGDERELPVGDL